MSGSSSAPVTAAAARRSCRSGPWAGRSPASPGSRSNGIRIAPSTTRLPSSVTMTRAMAPSIGPSYPEHAAGPEGTGWLRCGLAPLSRWVLARPVLVGLLDQPQVHEGLGLADTIDGTEPVGQEPEERLVVLADGLDEQVVGPGRDDDVVHFGHLGERLGDL